MSENGKLMALQQQMAGQPAPQSEMVAKIARLDKAVESLGQVTYQIDKHLVIPGENVAMEVQENLPKVGQPTLLMVRMDALDNIADRVIGIDRVLHRILSELQNL